MAAKGSDGLLMRAQPLGAAEEISRRIVEVQVMGDTLLLDADPAWAGAINTVLVKKGVRVKELRRVGETLSSDTQEVSTPGVPPPNEDPYGGCTNLRHVPSFTYRAGIGTPN